MKRFAKLLAVLVSVPFVAQSAAEERFPFVIPGDDTLAGTATDMSFLNDHPAGERGFVTTNDDGHFVYSDTGERVRWWGINLTFASNFPTHEQADFLAPHFAKLGINLVRFHHMDMQTAPGGLWKADWDGSGKRPFDADQIDRLDYFLAKLHEHGVYANLNLKCSRTLTEAEGFPQARGGLPWYLNFNKYISYYDPRVQSEIKDFCRRFLLHKNPYRGDRTRVEDAGVAMMEMMNEDSFTTKGIAPLSSLPQEHTEEFVKQWNAWLLKKYGSAAGLRAGWLQNSGAKRTLASSEEWAGGPGRWSVSELEGKMTYRFGAPGPDGRRGALQANIEQPAGTDWKQCFTADGLSLTRGVPHTFTMKVRSDRERSVKLILCTEEHGQWEDLGILEDVPIGPEWQTVDRVFEVKNEAANARLQLIVGGDTGEVTMADVALFEGVAAEPLAEDIDPAEGNVPLPGPTTSPQSAADLTAFMTETESAWLTEFRRFLTEDLNVRVPMCPSQVNYHPLDISATAGDFVDLHAYWQHPLWPKTRDWDPKGWVIVDVPMEPNPTVNKWPTNSLLARAGYRVPGKPFIVSEWNNCDPGRFTASGVFLPAVIMGLQDWDGIDFFSYENFGNSDGFDGPGGPWARDSFDNYFALNGIPTKLALLTACAPLVRRGDLDPLKDVITGTPDELIGGAVALRKRCTFDPTKSEPDTFEQPGTEESFDVSTPDGSVRWNADAGWVTVDTPNTVAVSGLVADERFVLGPAEVSFGKPFADYAAVVLTSVDGKPLAESERMLLTAVGSSENTGMVWDEEHKSVNDQWGGGPTRVNGIPLSLGMPGVSVYPLDGHGRRLGPAVDPTTLGGAHRTLWYEVTRE